MGKSGGKRKKSASAVGDGGTKLDSDDAVSFQWPEMHCCFICFLWTLSCVSQLQQKVKLYLNMPTQAFLKRAHELKDEGNKRFQAKEYAAALEKYEQALKLAPEGHPDRAVFHRSPTYITSQHCSNSVNSCNSVDIVFPHFVTLSVMILLHIRRRRAMQSFPSKCDMSRDS